jgi:FKBP-type peptidyl-prolyl cis-trans isomerase FkpA
MIQQLTIILRGIRLFLYGFLLFILMLSCGGQKNEKPKENKSRHEETLVKINKYLVDRDADKIRGYARRRNWDMAITGTGLWYMIYQKGTGEIAQTGKAVTLDYTVSLLNGTRCYSSDSLGQKKFRIGKGGVEKGLEEGLLLLRAGDKARFIMPPYLAYGLAGDQDRIPPRSIIVYDVELVQISD